MCNAWNHPDSCECGFGPPYTRSAAGYFDQRIGSGGGRNLSSAGPHTGRLAGAIGDDRLTTQLASIFFFQSYIGSRAFQWKMQPPKPGPAGESGAIYVVRHGKRWPRHDLLVFDPNLSRGEVTETEVEVSPADLRNGWPRFHRSYLKGTPIPEWLSGLRHEDIPEIAIEAMKAQRYSVIAMRPPKIVSTASASRTRQAAPQVPSPALGVSAQAARKPLSTVGVIAAAEGGRNGVTTALHALRGESCDNRVFVEDTAGAILSRDVITDSCFIVIRNSKLPRGRRARGPLTNLSPRRLDETWFDGVVSGRKTTYVEGWTVELPFWVPGIQSRIITPPVTEPGDSGAALVDQEGYILGFAFYRTGFNARGAHSGWIWAASVFAALHLN